MPPLYGCALMLLDPRNGPDFDLPAAPDARSYVLASTPRTGSTLLARALWDAGDAGAPKEYLNPMQLIDWERRFGTLASRLRHQLTVGPLQALVGPGWSARRMAAHLARVRARRSSPRWFGLKIHRHHLVRHLGSARGLDDALGGARWVWVRRRDRLGQAISWARALQTGQWAGHQRPYAAPRFRRAQITRLMARIERDELAWGLELAPFEPWVVWYEDLAADLHEAVQGVRGLLDLPPCVGSTPAPLTRQADAISAAWRERFLAGR